ncbi:MAG: glycosyltransferase [Tannerella forsythia]|uniref:glycosyltransferase family 4 protein n=1 Tax=Tannerella forsythia TaxID=28112 RepID=UPI00360A27E2
MNIAFLTTLNPYDINNWSGTTYHLLQILSKKHHVKVVGQNTLSQTAYYIKDNFSKRHPLDKYAPLFGELYAEQMSGSDLIFFGDLYLASFLDVNIPMVHLSDVTYHSFKDYSELKRSKEQIKKTETLEKKLLNKYTTIIYSSEWTKQNTIDYYDIEPNKIHVVEFGANIPAPSDYKIPIQTDTCNLVFIGKNWKKKGGDKVFMAYRKLKSKGLQCTLTIIGSTPQEPYDEIKDVTVIPFLDKSKPEHLKRLCNILKEAHFLVLPTEFDAFGIVFCEASAYGVPSIAANVGGVSQPVRDGKNGFLLPPNATAEDYAEKIKSVFSDKDGYIKLRESSRREYETRLNWEVWGEKVNRILEETVVNYKKCDNKTICQCNNITTCNLLSDNNISIGRQSKEQPLIDKEEFYVPVYVINLKERIERRKHIEEQFHGKPEFELT